MATIGLIEEMVKMPEIWYCMACNRCAQTCPTLVTPLRIISRIREEALRLRVVSVDMLNGYRKFFAAFDPLWITRMANLGLTEELLRSPAIWLCIQCGQCTASCSQSVKVHALIQGLRELAMDRDIVDSGFHRRLKKANRIVYPWFVDEVDRILGGTHRAEEAPSATGTHGMAS
ncbi:MAG: hypothetical protein U5R49_16495 [Deltaproteobacteria bacterium]|nr:hypothetical protein [Deltaproteobacteria bacterium]